MHAYIHHAPLTVSLLPPSSGASSSCSFSDICRTASDTGSSSSAWVGCTGRDIDQIARRKVSGALLRGLPPANI